MPLNIAKPTSQGLLEVSDRLGLGLSAEQVADYVGIVAANVRSYEIAAQVADAAAAPAPQGREHTVPPAAENAKNAWYVRSAIRESAGGPLAGRTIAVKDSIPVAGLPMLNGSNIFDGYVPEFDAEVVRRVLAAGAEITGKAHCEYLCLSGSSHTNITGPVHNPWADGYAAGGSSSGAAVVVALGEADMALGADQGGSIRIPASFSGIVGMKATTGLVPYTGIASLEASFDHVGPMTRTVADNALLLGAIAGPDGVDPRQQGVAPADYAEALALSAKGLRIGVVPEGFALPGHDPEVSTRVREAAEVFRRLGADVIDVSIPLHTKGSDIWNAIARTGIVENFLIGDGFGLLRDDFYPISMMRWVREHAAGISEAPPSAKLNFLVAEHVKQQVGAAGYGYGVNAARVLRRAYDEALDVVDILLMPTTAMTANRLPGASASLRDEAELSLAMTGNTAPFDVTHHPAISLPAGSAGGMPVGMMLIGKHYDESTLYRAAHAYEQTGQGL